MAELMLVNRRRRRKSTKKRRKTVAKRSPSRRLATTRTTTVRRYRRNPIRRTGMVETFKDGAVGAAGALAVDVAMAKLPIPEQLSSGTFAPVTKGVIGIGIGMLAAKVMKNKKLGEQLANGAVTVSLYNTGRNMLSGTIGLDGDLLGNDLLGYDDDLSYFDDVDDGMGYFDSAPTFDSDHDF